MLVNRGALKITSAKEFLGLKTGEEDWNGQTNKSDTH